MARSSRNADIGSPGHASGSPPRRLSGPARVVIVDDHPIVRKGLTQLLNEQPDLAVCGEADSPAAALALIDAERPDIALVDLSLGQDSGLELVKTVSASHRDIRLLVLSMRDEMLFAERALQAGASGYIMKNEAVRDLLTAVRRVLGGKTYVSERVTARILAGMGRRSHETLSIERLTDRERQVLDLIGRGVATRDIAKRLEVSVRTVESHCAHIKEKFGLRNARELVRFAVSRLESM